MRAGLIGAGAMANSVHYASLAELESIEPVALCDLLPDKLAATADRFGIEHRYTDWRLMLAEQDPEVVYLLMPPHQLYDIAATVLDQGRHLFIEKPPGITLTQIRNLAHKAEARDRRTMVGFNRRHLPVLLDCLARVRERGPIEQAAVTFHKHYFHGEYYNGAVDILTCDAIHAVDLIRFLCGEAVTVQSQVGRAGGEWYPNQFNALIEFDGGACGHLMCHFAGGKRFHHAEFHARGVTCYTPFEESGEVWADNGAEPVHRVTARELTGSDEMRINWGFAAEHRHFAACLAEGREATSSFADAVRTMELIDRIAHGG